MKDFLGTLVGGVIIAAFVALFASTMNGTSSTSGIDAGNLWAAALGLIALLLVLMGGWHGIFS